MEEILHQLRLVVYLIIYRVLAPSQVVSRISSINSMSKTGYNSSMDSGPSEVQVSTIRFGPSKIY